MNRAIVPASASSCAPTVVAPVEPVRGAASGRDASSRPAPTLVAQLLAARENLPQARCLRRAEPADAAAAYRAAATLGTVETAPRMDRQV